MPTHQPDRLISASGPGEPYEVACDESGFAGGNLVGPGHSTVFVHASVRLDPGVAAERWSAMCAARSVRRAVSTSRPN